MKMKKKRIVYSLTGRGLFSELSNLALALVYADYNQEELTVNTLKTMHTQTFGAYKEPISHNNLLK